MPRPARDVSACPRVVIVDADRRVQQSLGEVLRLTGEVEVIGSAGEVRGGLELIERERPDVIVIDPRLPDIDAGAALLSTVARAWPAMRVVLTGWADADDHPGLAGCACAFVTKSAPPEQFVSAIVNACSSPPVSGPTTAGA